MYIRLDRHPPVAGEARPDPIPASFRFAGLVCGLVVTLFMTGCIPAAFMLSRMESCSASLCTAIPVRGYDGPGRPVSEVAHMRVLAPGLELVRSGERQIAQTFGRFSFLELVPGEHTLTVARSMPGSSATHVVLRTRVEAGHYYLPALHWHADGEQIVFQDAGPDYLQRCPLPLWFTVGDNRKFHASGTSVSGSGC